MIIRFILAIVLALAPMSLAVAAEAVRPLPNADLSGIDRELADEIREFRARLDREKSKLGGVELGELYGDVGAVHARVGLFDVAEVAFANAESVAPLDGRWPYLRGLIAIARGQDAISRQAFERALKLNADYLPIRMALVNSLVRANELDRARQLLEPFVATHKTYPVPFAMLGDIAMRQKRYGDAVTLFKSALAAEPGANSLYQALAAAQKETGDGKGAEASLAKAGDVSPSISDPVMARIMPVVDIRPASATTSAGAAAGRSAQEPELDPRRAALGEVELATSVGQFDAARKRLDAALKQYPGDAGLLLGYARVEATAGNAAAARSRAAAATSSAPKEATAWSARAVIEDGLGDDAAAVASYRKALEVDAKFARAQIGIGNIELRGGRRAQAEDAYRAALALAPQSTDARARLIATQVLAGQCSTAIGEMTDAVKRFPRDGGIAELFVRVASTCQGATAEQRKRALSIAEELYKSPAGGSAQVSEAYALALAANGRWDDAGQTQGAAVFDAVSNGNNAASVALYRETYQRLQAKQLPTQPWPAAHPLFKPVRPAFRTASSPNATGNDPATPSPARAVAPPKAADRR